MTSGMPGRARQRGVVPSVRAFLVCGVFLFVAHALVSCGDADRRIVAHYPTLFDWPGSWACRSRSACCFVGAFWIMLWLGIALFNMIKLTGFATFIEHPWVCDPAHHHRRGRSDPCHGHARQSGARRAHAGAHLARLAAAGDRADRFRLPDQPDVHRPAALVGTRSATFLLMAAAVGAGDPHQCRLSGRRSGTPPAAHLARRRHAGRGAADLHRLDRGLRLVAARRPIWLDGGPHHLGGGRSDRGRVCGWISDRRDPAGPMAEADRALERLWHVCFPDRAVRTDHADC